MNNLSDMLSAYYTGSTGIFMLPVILFISFAAGIISSLSPCSLGILPLIIGYIGGYSNAGAKKLFIQLMFFSLGLASVLSIIGVLCAVSGRVFAAAASPPVIMIFASVIVILGLNLLGVIDIHFPSIVKKMPQNRNNGLIIFPFIIGVCFALASSPCAAPVLAGIMAFAAVSSNILFSIALLFSFAIGQCVIIIIFAMSARALKNTAKIAQYSDILLKISGILLILSGIYIWYSILAAIV